MSGLYFRGNGKCRVVHARGMKRSEYNAKSVFSTVVTTSTIGKIRFAGSIQGTSTFVGGYVRGSVRVRVPLASKIYFRRLVKLLGWGGVGRWAGVGLRRYCRTVRDGCSSIVEELKDRALIHGFMLGFLSSADFRKLGRKLRGRSTRLTFQDTRALGNIYVGLKFAGLFRIDSTLARRLQSERVGRGAARVFRRMRQRCAQAVRTVGKLYWRRSG